MAARQLDRTSLSDHVDRMYRAAWALCGSREEAEDLVQETFVRVMARPRLLHTDDDLGYLLRALRNTFLTRLRAAERRPVPEPLDSRLEFLEDNGARNPEAAAEAQEVYAAIAALPPKCRDALVAVDVIGLTYREAARSLRTRSETITSRLYRARGLVAAQLRTPEEGPASGSQADGREYSNEYSKASPKARPSPPVAESALFRDQLDEPAAVQPAR
jgi:RNA polymerase sigma-70 factor (ECF subfamily)